MKNHKQRLQGVLLLNLPKTAMTEAGVVLSQRRASTEFLSFLSIL